MSYTAPPGNTLPYAISTISGAAPQTAISTSDTWPAANQAIYVPVVVSERVVVRKLWYGNGAVATGNIDIGLYDSAGTRLASSGSSTKQTSADDQVYDISDVTIGPGVYYLALACSNATDTFATIVLTAPCIAALGVLIEGSAFPLPATATFALDQTLAKLPAIGMMFDTRAS